ncbi:sensory rhodopsin transducer [Paenibacillus koleovorans]|uniref:sensory rhodopsin transducer n=1 Tax=Paenibacillus koleovorans TaxID=121608 RepID=UPI000FDCB4E0|nr:sensory rhodopsin transducer [Paenibacillus koleovorans]
MHQAMGKTAWFIPDGYIPPTSAPGVYESHESICVLNTSGEDAKLTLTIYFEDRDPIEQVEAIVPGRRTRHIRTSSLRGSGGNGESIPTGVPYAIGIVSTVPVMIQYSRLDATQAENALMSIMAYPVG